MSEEGPVELLDDRYASKTFTLGGETGFFECLTFFGGMSFEGSLVLTEFLFCQVKCFSNYSKKG